MTCKRASLWIPHSYCLPPGLLTRGLYHMHDTQAKGWQLLQAQLVLLRSSFLNSQAASW